MSRTITFMIKASGIARTAPSGVRRIRLALTALGAGEPTHDYQGQRQGSIEPDFPERGTWLTQGVQTRHPKV
jgi:hypothetical protein